VLSATMFTVMAASAGLPVTSNRQTYEPPTVTPVNEQSGDIDATPLPACTETLSNERLGLSVISTVIVAPLLTILWEYPNWLCVGGDAIELPTISIDKRLSAILVIKTFPVCGTWTYL